MYAIYDFALLIYFFRYNMGLYKLIVIILWMVVFHNDMPQEPIHEPIVEVIQEKPLWNIKDWTGTYIKIQKVVKKESISRHILRSCRVVKNQKHCINTALWFAWIESSMFKTCKKNNCFGMRELVRPKQGQPYYRVIWFNSVNAGIDYWVENFYKPYLSRIRTAQDAINTGYCTGDCAIPGSTWSKTIERFIWYIK